MKDEIPPQILKELEKIALDNLFIPTLKPLGMDRADFHEVGVLSLSAALFKAYQLGKNSKKTQK